MLLNNVLVGQVNSDVFDQIQENVWYLPTADGSALLYVTSIGVGDTIVTLHGGPGNDFNYLVDAVKGNSSKNTFILFDQRGSLLSPVADSLIYKLALDDIVEDLETLRKSLHQDKMLLFGHSFGSMAVMSYYLKYPEHVKGIILSATMPAYINDDKPFKEILKEIHKRCQDLRRRSEIEAELVRAGLTNDSLLNARQRSDKFKILGLASFNMINIADWKKFKGGGVYYNPLVDNAIGETIPSTYDIRPTLDLYPIPITVIQGDKDYIDPSAQYWATVFTNHKLVELITVKNASHYIWLDDKLKFDTSMRYAIDRVKDKDNLKEISLIKTADYIINQYGDSIWENISRIPLRILLITDSLEYLINHNTPDKSFELYKYDSSLKTDIYVRQRKFPPFLRATFPAVNGIDCIVVGDCKNTHKSEEDWIIMLLHEHFHLYQGANPEYNENVSLLAQKIANKSDNWMLDYDFPYYDTTLNKLFKDYSSSIYETFINLDRNELNPELEGWRAKQAKIQNKMKSNDYNYFQFQLWQEGIATYTEFKYLDILNRNSSNLKIDHNLNFALKADNILKAYSSTLLKNDLKKQERNLFYALGLYIGIIKDHTNPEWKTDYFKALNVE